MLPSQGRVQTLVVLQTVLGNRVDRQLGCSAQVGQEILRRLPQVDYHRVAQKFGAVYCLGQGVVYGDSARYCNWLHPVSLPSLRYQFSLIILRHNFFSVFLLTARPASSS